MANYLLLTVVLVGLVAASLGSPVASDHVTNQDQLPVDMDGSEFFHSPYHRTAYGYGYPLNIPFRTGYADVPGVLPGFLNGVIPHQHPFFYRK
ncbi:hypothetical protein GHT06_007782 [Daphnia sinensis]|uniref:Secreted protein n=1 Tax=Daphnia sinensis TaxID=1820382 RepID=A0AAD5Q1F0_9CRUS|nr:hypothetical protein GHT06_007782 [Daphnia sinensis]